MKILFFMAFLIVWLPHFLFGQKLDLKRLEDYLTGEMDDCQIPGLAIGIIMDGEIVYCKGFGKNIGDNSQITADSPFVLASLTKSFTGLAISQLERQGKLRYTDNIRDHLPFFELNATDYQDSITINHLLNHRSGIPGISSYKTNIEGLDLEQKARRLRNIQGTGTFGDFTYANDNYVLLGLIIEKASQQSFQEYMQKEILVPLKLTHTFFSQREGALFDMAIGHQLYFGFPLPSKITYHKANLPNGGMLSSVRDLSHYLQHVMGFDAEAMPMIASLDKNNDIFESSPDDIYRKGWFISEYRGKKLYSHRGQLSDYQNYIGFIPEEKLGLVVLMNQNSLFMNKRISQIPEDVMTFLFDGSLPENTATLTTAYWIFIILSAAFLSFLVYSLIKEIRNNKFNTLSRKELRSAQLSTWIGNIIIPIAMMIWMWYLANHLMTALHLSQPDILFVIQLFFTYSIIVGLLRIYQIGITINTRKNQSG